MTYPSISESESLQGIKTLERPSEMGCSMEDSSVPAQTGRRKNTTENKNTETTLADKT
jgi:hypothetical protein